MASARIPLPVKLAFTLFMAVLVPIYWRDYGPQNFLYFCDIALFFTLAALWLESPLLASVPAVGILLPQALWQVDFLIQLFGGESYGLTGYMFDEKNKLFTRFLSFFHFWLPILLVWMVWRLGYDRRAFLLWSTLAALVLLVCYFYISPPHTPREPNEPVNINYVYGRSPDKPQEWMHPLAWLGLMMFGLPLVFYLPAHLALIWLMPAPDGRGARKWTSDGEMAKTSLSEPRPSGSG